MNRRPHDPFGPEELGELCRRHGLAATRQRRAVLLVLAHRSDHPTADWIVAEVRKQRPGISRATVYRILETLAQSGIARKICHPGSAARFEIAGLRHHHLVCMKCERMVDLMAPAFDKLPLPGSGSGFHIQDYSIYFVGLCSECALPGAGKRPPAKRPAAKAARPAKRPPKA
jgi:Fur family peroxide stress response transcriptional regulator